MMVNLLVLFPHKIFAHNEMLEVVYDNCFSSEDSGDINEKWYILDWFNEQYHLGQDEDTIIYYFENSSKNGSYSWTTDISEDEAQIIKDEYAGSMKKWNNVYFYSYNENGTITKNKVINVVEGTQDNCNLRIYPADGLQYHASTGKTGLPEEIQTGTISHNHYQMFEMNVYIGYFYEHSEYDPLRERTVNISQGYADIVRDRTGAHELGHMLGLFDLDYKWQGDFICNSSEVEQHHNEQLMGYGEDITKRSSDITYKDIAGVAITRGFHTDDDHKWLNYGLEENGMYKLICSICNGVKNVESLSGISYSSYGFCNGDHTMTSGNMMAVASYGNYDYYKCRYCRYVAPFSDIVPQSYEKTYYSEDLHKCENKATGLEYAYYEPHRLSGHTCMDCGAHVGSYTHHYQQYTDYAHKAFCECGEYVLEDHRHLAPSYDCIFCGAEHEHTYETSYEWISDKSHTAYCVCGESHIEGHVVSATAFPIHGRKVCLLCGGLASEGFSQMAVGSLPHTENGSYITPDGITVLADEDIEAFLNGTLEFIYPSVGETS